MKYVIMAAVVVLSTSVTARELTLEQALQLAHEHSHTLREAEANRLAAEKLVSAAQAERFPTLSVDALAKFVDEVPSLNIDLAAQVDIAREFGSKETYQTDLRLTLPLYTGGRISSAIALARSGSEYRAALNDLERDRVFLQARLDYFSLTRSAELLRAARASLRRTSVLQDNILSLYSAGAADSVDLLEARLAYTRADFQVQQAEISSQSQRITLVSRLGLPAQEQIELTDPIPDPPQELPLVAVSTERPELRAAVAGIRAGEARVRSEKAGYLPTLAAFGGYSYGKPNIDPFTNQWNDNFTVGAKLQWSLNLGGGTSSKKAAASFELDAARRRHDNTAESISRETELAYEQLRLAHRRYFSSRTEWDVAAANYDLAQQQHQNGALSSNRLLEIEAVLSHAEASLAAARVDFYIAQSAYYFALADERLGKGL
ncbi:MAG: TolC family protein [Candidatus Zixiibacteriota bacterium]